MLGRYRLQIRLTSPLGDFLQRLTLPFFCPVLPGTPVDPRGVAPAGSGPYYVAEHVVNQRVVLKRNPFYRGNRPANVDQIVWTVGQTREACLVAIEANRIDHCFPFGVPNAAYESLYEKYGVSARLAYNWRERYLLTTAAANLNIPAFSDDYGQLDATLLGGLLKVQGPVTLAGTETHSEGWTVNTATGLAGRISPGALTGVAP